MKALFNTDHFGFKVLNAIALNALVFNIFIPSLQAMGALEKKDSKRFAFPMQAASFQKSELGGNTIRRVTESSKKLKVVHLANQAAAGGPEQVESNSFSINSNDNILNKFTGDMAYTIPLMDVEGFPISITYNPNIGMDQEASWVGLGWDLALGSIAREMRGFPDDFKGEHIVREIKIEDQTVEGKKKGIGLGAGMGFGLAQDYKGGSLNIAVSTQFMIGKYQNSYTGIGHTKDLSVSLGVNAMGIGATGSLGYSSDDQNGIGVSAGITMNLAPTAYGISFGGAQFGKSVSVNSRQGFLDKMTTRGSTSGMSIGNVSSMSRSATGSMVSFGKRTYIPRYSFNTETTGSKEDDMFSMTGILVGGYGNLRLLKEEYKNETKFSLHDRGLPAYGYFYYGESEGNDEAMLDFNRDGKNEPSSAASFLNFSQPTFDLFYCNAPGITSNFRAHRYDIARLHDPKVTGQTNVSIESQDFGLFGGAIPPVVVGLGGVEEGSGNGTVTGSSYTAEGIAGDHFKFVDKNLTFNKKEYYLQTIGENTPGERDVLDPFYGTNAARLQLSYVGNTLDLSGTLESGSQTSSIPATTNLNRKDNIIHYKEYSGQDFTELGFKINDYELVLSNAASVPYNVDPRVMNNFASGKNPHHIQAIETINDQGTRYVFGIPNYTFSQTDVTMSHNVNSQYESETFNQQNETDARTKGMVTFQPDDYDDNNDGRQKMRERQRMPAYAHSFLLTQIYSNDYVDLTQNGPSKDDIGNYYKINYTNVYTKSEDPSDQPFKWRMPIAKSQYRAFYQENMKTDPWDDVALFSFGEKELWYGQSVESKDMIAFFKLEKRKDQNMFSTVNGAMLSNASGYLLKKIELYSKNDLEAGIANAKPLQVIEFDYDYSLCPEYPGNIDYYMNTSAVNTGKLTLKAIYSYTGKSKENKTTPYLFKYGSSEEENPSYAESASDRWGNYKPNNTLFPNHEFPYSEQDPVEALKNIKAWKLKSIDLPGGGSMEFEYTPDSYAYVQNKRAMRMFSIVGMGSNELPLQVINSLPASAIDENYMTTYTKSEIREPDDKKDPHEVIYFKLAEPITGISRLEASEQLRQQYFTDESGQVVNKILVNMLANLGNKQHPGYEQYQYEYVQSIITVGKIGNHLQAGVVGDGPGPWNYGYMIITKQAINDNSEDYLVSTLQLSNWQFARKNTPYVIYGEPDYTINDPLTFCDWSTDLDGRVVFGLDVNKKINKKKYGLEFKRMQSQVRLYEPDNVKLGGNARIASITYKNRWNEVSGEQASTYRWVYNYDLEAGSSGVAAYEPQAGSVENPLYQLSGYDMDRYFLPDEKNYQFLPVCDMMYPAPLVGYSKIESSFSEDIIAKEKSVGKNVEHYYTSKDFPLVFRHTSTPAIVDRTGESAILTDNSVKELMGLSQGFVVETNDMHGKIKMIELYDAADKLISSQTYFYADFNDKSVEYLGENGAIKPNYPPREIDMYVDSWESYQTLSTSLSGDFNSLGAMFVLVPAVPSPVPFPIIKQHDYSYSSESLRSIKAFTFTKTINHSAVLKKVNSFTLGSSNSAENRLYDPRSGQVVLSSLNDEFNDPLYSFSYPSHWKYRSFLNMNQMDGYIFTPGFSGDMATVNDIPFRFTEGDHFKITVPNEDPFYAWVISTSLKETSASLIDVNGDKILAADMQGGEFQLIRTGRKNRMSENMMSIRTKRNPYTPDKTLCRLALAGDDSKFLKDILDVSAVMYSDKANVPCQENGVRSLANIINQTAPDNFSVGDKVNPFLIGAKANYQVVNALAYQSGRKTLEFDNDVRQDGEIEGYVPFYSYREGTVETEDGQFANGPKHWYALPERYHPFHHEGSYLQWRILGKIDAYNEQHIPIQVSNQIKVPSAHLKVLNENHFVLQEATASNAKYNEIGFEGFELAQTVSPVLDNGFNLREMFPAGQLVTTQKHSGNYSLGVATTSSATFNARPSDPLCSGNNIVENEYFVRNCDCIPNFEQSQGAEYLLSVWVKEVEQQASYANSAVKIYFLASDNTVLTSETRTISPSGKIIDGWQKIEAAYIIPATAAKVRFEFVNTSASSSYFDDFRTHPVLSAMQSIVYDQKTLLPIASHDAYNFTTFFNYDNNHELTRVKVETIDGIRTISETEMGTYRIGN